MRHLALASLLGLAGILVVSAGAAAPAVHVAGDVRPPVLTRLEPIDGLTAVAIAEGGLRAAYARIDPDRPERSRLGLVDAGDAKSVESELPGIVRDLVWVDGQSRLLGVVFRPARHREGTTDLLEIDPVTAKSRRVLRLAPSARSLERLAGTPLLLLAARDGLRTVRLPELRSGPLYRIPGENLSVAWLGGTRVLIGREDGLALVDLDDPPGEEGLPVRARASAPEPVVGLAASADGQIEARLADGRLFGVELAPLRLVDREQTSATLARISSSSGDTEATRLPRGAAEPTAAPSAGPAPSPGPPPVTSSTAAAPSTVATPSTAAATPSPAPRTAEEPATPPAAAPATPPTDEVVAPESTTPPPAPPAPAPAVVPPGARGRVEGPAAGGARAVVLLGPGNILRQSARAPVHDGAWSAGRLAPGRYRVQVEGGANTVLVCDPPFVTVDVSDGVAEAPTIRVLREM